MSELILVVDDEEDLATTLEFNLQREGYRTRVANNGQQALDLAADTPRPNLVLLDLMLPDLSGIEVCRRLRNDAETRNVPIVMLTACGDEIDRVVGLEMGADDYVVKPFSTRELMLRVRAILRRNVAEDAAGISAFGALRVDAEAHRVWVADDEIMLTPMELRLLSTLMQRRGRVQSRERLLEDVWQMRADVTSRTIDTHVRRLRSKLGEAADYIETIRGVGYRFRAEGERRVGAGASGSGLHCGDEIQAG